MESRNVGRYLKQKTDAESNRIKKKKKNQVLGRAACCNINPAGCGFGRLNSAQLPPPNPSRPPPLSPSISGHFSVMCLSSLDFWVRGRDGIDLEHRCGRRSQRARAMICSGGRWRGASHLREKLLAVAAERPVAELLI